MTKIFILLILTSFFNTFLFSQVIHTKQKNLIAGIHGRVWGPDNVPVVGANVIVTDENLEILYGEDISISQPGPDDGHYQITELPINEKLIVYVFHKNIPGLLAIQKIRLKKNEFKKVNIAIQSNFSDPGFIALQAGGALSLSGFVLRITTLLNQVQNYTSTQKIIRYLKSLENQVSNINDGLLGYYPFNGNAYDESGNGNNGNVSDATLTEDRFGNPNSAYSFDGVDDYILIPNRKAFNFLHNGNNFTISLWLKRSHLSEDSQRIILSNTRGGDVNGVQFYSNDRNISFYIGTHSRTFPVVHGVWNNIYPDDTLSVPHSLDRFLSNLRCINLQILLFISTKSIPLLGFYN